MLSAACLAPHAHLPAKSFLFSLFLLTGCKFASGWQPKVGTASEEPAVGPSVPSCGGVHRAPQAALAAGGSELGSQPMGLTQEFPKSLAGSWCSAPQADSFLAALKDGIEGSISLPWCPRGIACSHARNVNPASPQAPAPQIKRCQRRQLLAMGIFSELQMFPPLGKLHLQYLTAERGFLFHYTLIQLPLSAGCAQMPEDGVRPVLVPKQRAPSISTAHRAESG